MIKIKYNDKVRWGAAELATDVTAYGEIIGGSRKKSAKTTEIADRNGELFSLVIFDITEEFDLEVIASKTAALPEIGDVLTIRGKQAIVLSCDESWKNNDAVKFKVTCKAWVNAGNPTPVTTP